MIIGCPGAGKSTFARRLRDATGLPLYYLDMLWHRPDRTTISKEEFDRKLEKIAGRSEWIIDGNYQRTLEMRMERCDTIILLDYPTEICLGGAQERVGKQQEDMPWIETELDSEFRQWIVDFPRDQLPAIYDLLAKYHVGRKVVVFRSRREADDYLGKLCLHLNGYSCKVE